VDRAVRVEAAGAVLWRGDPAAPEVALVHRPRYDDWSLPKGKLDPGEHPLLGALREVEEETGFAARPGRRLPTTRYDVLDGPKRVRYWACEATGGAFDPGREVDELVWLPVPAAMTKVTFDRDGEVLAGFAADTRRTRALVVVRHASAGDKRAWAGPDRDRPLDPAGRAQAEAIVGLLVAYDVRRAGTADVLRCRATLAPFAAATGVEVAELPATSAPAYEDAADAAADAVFALLDGVGGCAWCGQREVIPALVAAVCGRLGGRVGPGDLAGLPKGRLLVLHVTETGELATLDRLPP
jgi:8-oxo-dGTP diphosphatase